MKNLILIFMFLGVAMVCLAGDAVQLCGCCEACHCPAGSDCSDCYCKRNVESEYNLLLFSDTHYNRSQYDRNTVLPSFWNSERDSSYTMWDDASDGVSYGMLEAAAKDKDEKTRFIIHAGDLIQGDFDSPENTALATSAAIKVITDTIGLPLYMAYDNHDSSRYTKDSDEGKYPTFSPAYDYDYHAIPTFATRGLCEQAFLEVAKKYQIENLDVACYEKPLFMTKEFGQDLFIFTRGTKAGMRYLYNELKRHPKENWRYTFVIVHLAPILGKSYGTAKPWQTDCFSYYRVLSNDNYQLICRDAELESQILDNLAEREAIVLTGHKHYWEKIDATYAGKGTIHQLMVNSNRKYYADKWTECRKPEDFAVSAANDKDGQSFLDSNGAEITGYRLFSGRGYAKLNISDDGVSVTAKYAQNDSNVFSQETIILIQK